MASARNSRTLFWSGLWIYSVATGLASMIFMAWAFYVETTGRGALFIEPNRVLAAGELATVATGMIALLVLFFRGLSQKEQPLTESFQE
jgi:hypothetical protein